MQAAWVLGALAGEGRFGTCLRAARLRALEATLFMIGYELPTPKMKPPPPRGGDSSKRRQRSAARHLEVRCVTTSVCRAARRSESASRTAPSIEPHLLTRDRRAVRVYETVGTLSKSSRESRDDDDGTAPSGSMAS